MVGNISSRHRNTRGVDFAVAVESYVNAVPNNNIGSMMNGGGPMLAVVVMMEFVV